MLRLVANRAHQTALRTVSTSAAAAATGTKKMQRPPFKEVESSRDEFETTSTYKMTKAPDPDWTVGQGRNQHPEKDRFSPTIRKAVYSAAELSGAENYKMIVGGVIPRPIAFISSQDSNGTRNLAPYSYFGAASHNPPTVMISMNVKGGGPKDSTANILETKRFTVNLISEPFIEAANWTSIDAPAEVDEWALSGLTPVPSEYWGGQGPPRVGESAFALECELHEHIPLKNDEGASTGTIVIGRIRNYVVNEGVRQSDGSLDPKGLLPISRGGGITYFRSTQGFELPRPVWKEEQERSEVKAVLNSSNRRSKAS